MRGVLPGDIYPVIAALMGARGAGKTGAFDVAELDRLVALAKGLAPKSWRSRYFGDESARVFIFGDRLRVFVRRAA